MSKRQNRPRRLGPIEQDFLLQISAGDMFVGFLLSGRSTKVMYRTARERAARRQAEQRALSRLSEHGFVIQNRDEKLRLSAKGKTELEHIIAKMRSEAPFRDQKWKGGWWIFAFDVPEIHRGARDAMRLILKRAGFLQLQQSVWVHPFECEELRELLCEDPRLEGRVIYARVDKLNNEVRLLAHFGLQRKP